MGENVGLFRFYPNTCHLLRALSHCTLLCGGYDVRLEGSLRGSITTDQWDAIEQLTAFLMRTHRVEHITQAELCQTIIDREKQMSTGMGEGIAIPHGRIKRGRQIQGVMGILRHGHGLYFDAPDGNPVQLIMLIVTPEKKKDMHLKVMGSLSAMLSDETIRNRIIASISPEDAMEVIESEEARGFNYFLD